MSPDDARARWAGSGALALTGDAAGAGLVAPRGTVERIVALGAALGVDALALLVERAAVAGLSRRGAVSCGGATRLLPVGGGGWLAVSLARPDDVDLVPAWLGLAGPPADVWAAVATAARGAPDAAALAAAGAGLGLAVGALPRSPPEAAGAGVADPVVAERVGEAPPLAGRPLVVDLSSLWAGPLCTRLLGERGSRVVKVEATGRPDGARQGPPAFFDLLHAGQRSVALDFRDPAGLDRLRRLVGAADVVVEGSRPRALAQLGIAPAGQRVWLSITGHGRTGAAADRVAFGDDAAVAGGLVAWGGDGRPRFVADAVADPLTGLAAAGAVTAALAAGGRWRLDAALSRVAAVVAGTDAGATWAPARPGEAVAPVAPRPRGRAPDLGADTGAVLAELGIG